MSACITLSVDTPHLLVQPAYECCYPRLSSVLTKCNIGFRADSVLACLIFCTEAYCDCKGVGGGGEKAVSDYKMLV